MIQKELAGELGKVRGETISCDTLWMQQISDSSLVQDCIHILFGITDAVDGGGTTPLYK